VVVKGKWGSAACAVALTGVTVLSAGCSSGGGGGSDSVATTLSANYGPAESTTVTVGAVPAMDSAGFFVALKEGLFAKEGLNIDYTPAVSSETAVAQQLAGKLDISAGNYVSYIQEAANKHEPIEIVSEGSVMQQGAQTIYVMPQSHINTLSQLKGKLIGVNAPDNIDYLLDVSVLKENGINPSQVRFPTGKEKASAQFHDGGAIPFPEMAGLLQSGAISAATLPEPFASQAEQQDGAVPLTDLNQGATTNFPIEGYVVTRAWAAKNHNTLQRFLAALSAGQEIADTDRTLVEKAFEGINGPQNGQVQAQIAAVMALDTYPIGIDATRLQRVANVMFQFGLLSKPYKVTNMLLPSSAFNFSPFSAS
jgi:NitT/TauT family transport system substrate-binding protein